MVLRRKYLPATGQAHQGSRSCSQSAICSLCVKPTETGRQSVAPTQLYSFEPNTVPESGRKHKSGLLTSQYAVQLPLWSQKAGNIDNMGFICYDYHVIAIELFPDQETLVYDFDRCGRSSLSAYCSPALMLRLISFLSHQYPALP